MRCTLLFLVSFWANLNAQPEVTKLLSVGEPIRHVTGLDKYDILAVATESTLIISTDGEEVSFTSLTYEFSGASYQTDPSLITEMAITRWGRILVATSDGHLLMFEDGILVAGFPLFVRDLYSTGAGNLGDFETYGIALIGNDFLPVQFDDCPGDYEKIGSLFNPPGNEFMALYSNEDPSLLAISEGYSVFVNPDKPSLIIGYLSGHEMALHNPFNSLMPCSSVLDVACPNSYLVNPWDSIGVYRQIYLLCDDGEVSYVTIQEKDYGKEWTESDWDVVNLPFPDKVLSLHPSKSTLTTDAFDRFSIYGRTSGEENGLVVINPYVKTVCQFDLPGTGVISDLYVDLGYILYASVGKDVYRVNVEDVPCEGGTSIVDVSQMNENGLIIFGNPAMDWVDLRVDPKLFRGMFAARVLNQLGQEVPVSYTVTDWGIQLGISGLSCGTYMVQVWDHFGSVSTELFLKTDD